VQTSKGRVYLRSLDEFWTSYVVTAYRGYVVTAYTLESLLKILREKEWGGS